MATPTISTSNPLGFNNQTGFFSATPGTPINQAFFDAAFAGRLNPNPIYRETYNCEILARCGISQWLDEMANYSTDCHPEWTLLEKSSLREQIKVKTNVTVAAYPATTVIALDNTSDHFISGAYVLPQVGNSVVLPPYGQIADITAVTHATAYDTTITVRLRPGVTGTVTLVAGDEAFVLSGSTIVDCACPTGQFAVKDIPLERDIAMIHFGDKGELCGDALDKCQWLKIDFSDNAGNIVDQRWWNEPLRDMYRRHEDRKTYEDLFNDVWGIIPTVKALGILLTPTATTEITITDLRAWVAKMDLNSVYCREYAVFAGTAIYSQLMQMLETQNIARLGYEQMPYNDCKWLNLEWCGVKVEGLTLHIYKDCSFSQGKSFGGAHWVYPTSALFVPMCNNSDTVNTTSNGRMQLEGDGYRNKMFTRVYFRSAADGSVFNSKTDADGILSQKNTYGPGCRNQAWTIESRYANELHCAKSWMYIGL